jgi:hypothetical protein
MAKTRPCVVVTPSDLNMYLTIVVIAPITSTIRNYPYRVLCSVAGRDGEIGTDVLLLQFAASGGIEIAIDTACLAKRYMNIDACHGMLMDICCKNSLLAGEYIGFRDI